MILRANSQILDRFKTFAWFSSTTDSLTDEKIGRIAEISGFRGRGIKNFAFGALRGCLGMILRSKSQILDRFKTFAWFSSTTDTLTAGQGWPSGHFV